MTFLHSIAISNNVQFDLGPTIACHIESLKRFHPEYKHILWTEEKIQSFLEKYYDKAILMAYEKIIPAAFKADLARLCILFQLGGIYADLSLFFMGSLPLNELSGKENIIFRLNWNPGSVHNALIFSQPKSYLMSLCINQAVHNINYSFYGKTELDPTGPELISNIIKGLKKKNISILYGDTKCVLNNNPLQLFYTLGNNGRENPIAIRNKPILDCQGISILGAKGFDNQCYSNAWIQRKIYKN